MACLLDKNSGTQTFAYEGLAVIRTPELDKVGKILHVRVSRLAIFVFLGHDKRSAWDVLVFHDDRTVSFVREHFIAVDNNTRT